MHNRIEIASQGSHPIDSASLLSETVEIAASVNVSEPSHTITYNCKFLSAITSFL
jgi:hypothetical protein